MPRVCRWASAVTAQLVTATIALLVLGQYYEARRQHPDTGVARGGAHDAASYTWKLHGNLCVMPGGDGTVSAYVSWCVLSVLLSVCLYACDATWLAPASCGRTNLPIIEVLHNVFRENVNVNVRVTSWTIQNDSTGDDRTLQRWIFRWT